MFKGWINNLCSRFIGARAGVTTQDLGGAGASAPRPAAGVRPASAGSKHPVKWLWTALLLICLAPFQAMSANNGDLIINRAQLNSLEFPPVSSSVTVTYQARTPSTIELLKYVPGVPGATALPVATTYYLDSTGKFIEMTPPTAGGTQTQINLSSPVPLLPYSSFPKGETVFIRVTDLDQNLDRTRAETVLVTVSDTDTITHDTKTLRLTETGPDTGVFIGYIQTTGVASNATLYVTESSSINAHYTDIVDGSDHQDVAALVDPFGIIFDSFTGKPIEDVTVELLYAADGKQAKVFGETGLEFKQPVISGGIGTDIAVKLSDKVSSYVFSPGGYRFPFVVPGSYVLKITPPDGYTLASTDQINRDRIQKQFGAQFAILQDASYGKAFSVPAGSAIRVDIPLDPKIGTLWLSKSAGKSVISAGEYLSYDVTLENTDSVGTVFAAVVTDRLPSGFRYQKGSARLNGLAVSDPAVSSDGGTLTFNVGTIAPKASALLRYIVGVGAGAKPGTAINIATASTTPAVSSNTASASVAVQEPFMQSRSILMGRVIVGACSDNIEDNKKGMDGVGIFLEDGTFVITDKLGMFHFEGVRAGSHVVQLDLDSIPEGYQILPCEQNSRFAGRAYSQFVDMQGGTMWRTDFYLGKKGLAPSAAGASPLKSTAGGKTVKAAPQASATDPKSEAPADARYLGELTLEMISSQSGDSIDYRIPLQAATVPLTNLRLRVTLPHGASYHKGSSSFDGSALPDPEVAADSLSYQLGSAGADWRKELRFRVSIDRKAAGGELRTKAALTFDSPTAKDVSAPELDNLLSLVKEESRVSLPGIVLHPQFPTFGAELSQGDRKELDELALVLSRFKIDRIDVAGHTDIVRIAARSRKIHAGNNALSFARARSVGRYLTAALHLPPESLNLSGRGEREPMATNRTAAGRAMNRRVEVKVSLSQEMETTHLTIVKGASGLKKQLTTGGPVWQGGEEANRLSPAQPKDEAVLVQLASNATEVVLPADNLSAAALPLPGNPLEKSNPRTKSAASLPAKNAERVELISTLNEGIVHYRIKLVGVKGPLEKVTVTLITPKSLLYMTGTSSLSGTPAADPETKESTIAYNFAKLPKNNKFDLRLQTLIDGDDKPEAQGSSVTVVISDADGKPLKSFTASAEITDNMEEINRPDIPAGAASQPVKTAVTEIDPTEEYHERVVMIDKTIPAAKTALDKPDTGSHVTEEAGIVSPADGSIIVNQINAIRIVLNSNLTPVLTLDGKEIPAERIGFSMVDRKAEKSLYTYIGVDFGDSGEHELQLKGLDTFGVTRFSKNAKITRAGEIATIKLVSAEGNIADGRTPVKVRVQLFDKNNNPVSTNFELAVKGGDLRPLSTSGNIGLDAAAAMVAVNGEGWINFQPVTASGLYRVQLAYNKATVDIETYIKPKMRDWILVGLGEGTAGYKTATGNMDNLKASGEEERFYDKERLAFYAKGTIKGEWLLTMAYDSAKQSTGVSGNALFQNIDPNAFYTLYGDASTQGYDAASQKKLYLRVERDQFYAMYGDFDTGLSVTELSRYSRRMNGVKAEFRSKDYELTAFGSETGQSFAKDEIRGDGTSGLYRLSRKGIVVNSEKITIESRDRFHSETVTQTRQMSRFVDYSIDYDTGAIFFKGPVANRDELLNPVYIVVDYEIAQAGSDALTYGGRAGTKLLNGNLKLGGTYIHEGNVGGSNNLYGADATMTLGPGTKARAEIATSNNDTGLMKGSGKAYLAEVTHNDKALDGKAYYREQDNGFGLGQQMGSEVGTRKFGAEGAYKLSTNTVLSAQAYRQYNLAGGTVRDFIESLATYNGKEFSTRAGLRYADDTLADGSHATSVLGTAGGSWKTLNERLTLRADHEQALSGKNNNADFPTKTTLGADYQATKAVTIFAQEELTYGAAANTNTTRLGIKATPWSGGTVSSSVANDIRENNDRTFANVGLAQKWQVTPRWTVDGGLERNQTIRKKTGYQLDANVPPASGGEDFTAVSAGANFQEKKLIWSNRFEYRTSDTDNKWGLITGVMNEQGLYWGWTGKLQILHTQSTGGINNTDADLRLGLAYRPPVTRWIVLDRLDLIATDDKSAGSSTHGKRIINNLNANFKPDQKTQLSLQYGAKYVLEQIDENDYRGFTDLIGVEGRYNLTQAWDIGLRGSILHTWEMKQLSYSFGPSVGYNLMKNAWLSLGYNLLGFHDKDFSTANFTSQGPFVQFRFKFDQNSVKDGLQALNQ